MATASQPTTAQLMRSLDIIEDKWDRLEKQRDQALARLAKLAGAKLGDMIDLMAKNPDLKLADTNGEIDRINAEFLILSGMRVQVLSELAESQERDRQAKVQGVKPAHRKVSAEIIESLCRLWVLFREESALRDSVRCFNSGAVLDPLQAPTMFNGFLENSPHSGLSLMIRRALENQVLKGGEAFLKDRKYNYS